MKTGLLRALAVALPLSGLVAADTLVLNDGTRYTGTFVIGNRSRITFSTDDGGRRTFDRGDVRMLRFGEGRDEDRNVRGSSDRERNGGALNDYDRNTRERDRGYDRGGSNRDGSFSDMDRASQAMGSSLGNATSEPQDLGDSRGKVRRYANGSVYWTRDTGAHAVSGSILQAWQRAGAERSRLGYPISDESGATDNGSGRVQQFENGSIYVDQYGRTRIDYTR